MRLYTFSALRRDLEHVLRVYNYANLVIFHEDDILPFFIFVFYNAPISGYKKQNHPLARCS